VIFVDTLKMFPETLEYRETLMQAFGFTDSRVVTPLEDVLAAKDANGLRWSYDPDGCCDIRKVEPLARAKQGLDTWISGRKAFQSVTRQNLPRFEVEDGRLKLNPLGDWTKDDLEAYFAEHDLPRHPLEAQGYLSIGCEPCTSKVLPGEDPPRRALARVGQGGVRHPHRLDPARGPGRSGQHAGVLSGLPNATIPIPSPTRLALRAAWGRDPT
jgi:phosphoadenosine phosphosulfate reductase